MVRGQGVPQQFPFEKDSAQFRQLSQVPGVELYHAHIERYAFEPHTHNAFAIGTVDFGDNRYGVTPVRYQKQVTAR
ncbi:hypothetical protein SPRA44_340037 [Serratia proteamaculans]|nr:hypothetical protein SPRA44_340037 [Serratia proteamaculans]